MTSTEFLTASGAGAVCLILAVCVIGFGQAAQSEQTALQKRQIELQTEFQGRQEQVNRGNLSQQVGTNIVRDLASASVNNSEIKALLARHGFNVTVNDPAIPATSPTP